MDSTSSVSLRETSPPPSASSISLVDAFGASRAAAGSCPVSTTGIEVLDLVNVPNTFSFDGRSRPARPGVLPCQGASCRLKPTCGVRMTNTPFFACNGMRLSTPAAAFLTMAAPGHVPDNMKDPLPSKTTMLPLSITPDTSSKGLRTLAPSNVIQLRISLPPCCLVLTFTVKFIKRSNFSPPGPTCRYSFKEPFEGLGHSAVFTNDSPVPEPTVNAPYRPHFSICPSDFVLDGQCYRSTPLRQAGLLHCWRCRNGVASAGTCRSKMPNF